jgi:8-oxo-dGTP pyrophosphatase MutT (NUDIX family)
VDAAARELREETGLLVRPDALSLVHLLHCRQGDGGGEWLGAFFEAGAWAGTPSIQEPRKHDALGWFDIHALPADTIPYTRQGLVLAEARIAYSSFGWDAVAGATVTGT